VHPFRSYLIAAVLTGVLYLGTVQSSFSQNLILNGDFTDVITAPSSPTGGQIGYNTTVADWSTTGYNFIFVSPNLGAQSVTGSDGGLSLWDTSNGGSGTLTAPPKGGNIVANDGAYEVAALTQSVSGLTAGQQYAVSFEYAGAQQSGFTGTTTESWTVSLGGTNAQTTPVLNNADKGFTGWFSETFDFTASGTMETLSFLANGTPNGEPPFSLLSDVTLVAVPEPKASAGGMIVFAMLIMAGTRTWRRRQKKSSAII
jgi:hypothetical protein